MATAPTTARQINLQSVKTIMNQRDLITDAFVGKVTRFIIQGNGTLMDVKDKAGELVLSTIPGQEGVVLQKRIYNLRANAQRAMRNPRNLDDLRLGIEAEKVGKTAEAHELLNAYLNRCQMNFGLLLPSPLEAKLMNGVEISARVIEIVTDNGSLLTIDPKTIAVIEPEIAGKTTFSVEDLFNASADDTIPGEKEAEALAAAEATIALLDKKAKSKWTVDDKKAYAEAQATISLATASTK